jgi:hypothetical protein
MSSFVINPYAFAAPFVPTDISGLRLWLDATTGLFDATTGGSAVTTDASEVARWEDQSGNAYHVTQGTSANRPVLKTSILNGKNVLRFDGSNDLLSNGSNFAISGGSNRSVFTVFNRATTALSIIVGWGDTGPTAGASSQYSSEYFLRFTSTTKGYTNQSGIDDWIIWSVIGNGDTLADYDAFFNGGSVATPNSTLNNSTTINTTANPLYIGRGPATGSANGDLAELLIYDSALSTSDREAVRDYLNAKWAVY